MNTWFEWAKKAYEEQEMQNIAHDIWKVIGNLYLKQIEKSIMDGDSTTKII